MDQDIRQTIRLLIVDTEAAEAEVMLSIFRDVGYATRGQHIISTDSLEEALGEHQQWDLMLVSELPENLSISSLIDLMTQLGRDIPVIVLQDEEEPFELMKLGVQAVIPRDEDEHLLLVANKEVEALRIRRHYRRMSIALQTSEKQRCMLLDDQTDAVLYISEGVIRYANPALNKMLGVEDAESLIGEPVKQLVSESDKQQVEAFLLNVENSGQATAVIQCPLLMEDGSEKPVRIVISPTSFEGEYTLSLQVRPLLPVQELSVQELPVQELPVQKKAEMDQSGAVLISDPVNHNKLFDKTEFQEQLDVAIQRAVSGKRTTALMCITLDTLKTVHEKGGRKISQPMLLQFAEKLQDFLAGSHRAASWGNGLFMLLLNAEDKKQVQQIADDILSFIGTEIEVGNNQLPVRLSLGAILLSDTSNDAKTLLVRARHAATQAHKENGGKLCFYQQRKINVVNSVEKHLAGMVSQALKNDNMQLLYQPVISLKGSSEEYYEVFVRMTDVRGRKHDAASFRAKLDRNSLWSKVDRWQLIQASKELMAKRKDGHDTRLILQLGASAITDDSFIPWIGVALKAAGIPAEAVALELSEPNLVRFNKEVPEFFKSIKKMGCQTGISDFGCSLNPLDSIEPLDVDLIRIDPSFTREITNTDKGRELKKLISALEQKHCKVIVPQVESADEMAPLWQSGVDFIQGPFLQNPTEKMSFDFGSDN